MRGAERIARLVRGRREPTDAELVGLTDEDRRAMTSLHDTSVALPSGAEEYLRSDNPRLKELRLAYRAVDLPVRSPSRWHDDAVESFLDLRWFRGETLITWHYRELPRVTRLKYLLYAREVARRDTLGLLDSLVEDGAFGCWTFDYPGLGTVSRDLLDSVSEISFLDSELGLSGRERFAVLDVGAGYGRLGARMAAAFGALHDYCCVDAIPECTFLAEYYLAHRGATPPARVAALHRLDSELQRGAFDLAVNVHSFSECPEAAIGWWLERLAALRVPSLMLIPNDGRRLLSLEPDGSRRDFAPLLESAGYGLERCEPVVGDPAAREVLELHDHFHLYSLGG